MKIHFRFFVLCAVALLFGTLYTATRATRVQPRNQRSIGRLRPERDEPLRIRAVKVKGKPVLRNKKFDVDEDWLKDLTISVRNVSRKRILFVSIDLLFSAPPESGGLRAIDEIDYGNRELLTRPPTRDEVRSGVEPGQEIDIQLNGIGYGRIRSLLTDLGYLGIPQVDLRIGRVIFEDDSTWYAGSQFRRDRGDSKSWTNTEKPIQSGNASAGVTNSLARIVPASDTFRTNAAGTPSAGQLPIPWNSSLPRASFPQLDALLVRTSYHPAPPQSSCYRIVNSQNVWCFVQPGCTHLKDYTDMLPGGYLIQNWPTSCKDRLGNWCGTDSTTTRIPCIYPPGGGGGGGGGGEGGGCSSDWDCFAGEECASGTCQQYGGGFGWLEPE